MSNDENLIAKNKIDRHRVSKYEFRPITADEPVNIAETSVTNQDITPNDIVNTEQESGIEKELIEKLLFKTDELSSSLAKMQIQFEKQELEMESRINTARNDAYKDGMLEGVEKTKKELEAELTKQKEAWIDSAIKLDKIMQDSQKHLRELEKELSAIAVDIAKEVIACEVSENSSKIATALAKELLGSIADTTDILLRVNNADFQEVSENLKDYKKIKIEADNAVKNGGVIISNCGGLIDGSISNRYKTLKQSVLDNLKDIE